MKRVGLALVCVFLLLGTATPTLAQTPDTGVVLDDPGIDKATVARLIANGELLLVRETPAGKLQMITSGILIDKTVDEVYQTITDYAHYPEFMPSTEECQVVAANGDVKDVRYGIKFKFLIFSFTIDYVLRTTLHPPAEVTWTLLSSDGNKLKKSVGSWRLLPVNGGKQTAAFYSVYSDISNVVPGLGGYIKKNPSMETAINVSTCIMVLRAVKNRSENPGWKQTK
jgi:ribosome-associated toxin RatA of RatAB toxin-antitoxin module